VGLGYKASLQELSYSVRDKCISSLEDSDIHTSKLGHFWNIGDDDDDAVDM